MKKKTIKVKTFVDENDEKRRVYRLTLQQVMFEGRGSDYDEWLLAIWDLGTTESRKYKKVCERRYCSYFTSLNRCLDDYEVWEKDIFNIAKAAKTIKKYGCSVK